jgi:hypothetical protein
MGTRILPCGVRWSVVWETTLSPSCAEGLEILGSSTSETFRASPGLHTDCYSSNCAEQELYGTVSSIAVSVFWKLIVNFYALFNFEIVVSKKGSVNLDLCRKLRILITAVLIKWERLKSANWKHLLQKMQKVIKSNSHHKIFNISDYLKCITVLNVCIAHL